MEYWTDLFFFALKVIFMSEIHLPASQSLHAEIDCAYLIHIIKPHHLRRLCEIVRE